MSEPEDTSQTEDRTGINRRRLLQTLGVAAAGFVGVTGTASAHQSKFFGCQRVCTGTQGSYAVVAVDDTYRCREMQQASGTTDVPWDWTTYCYEATDGEVVVGLLEENVVQGGTENENGSCTLCLNGNACAASAYGSASAVVTALNESDTCDVCAGNVEVSSSCTTYTAPPDDEDDAGDDSSGDGSNDDSNEDDNDGDDSSDDGNDGDDSNDDSNEDDNDGDDSSEDGSNDDSNGDGNGGDSSTGDDSNGDDGDDSSDGNGENDNGENGDGEDTSGDQGADDAEAVSNDGPIPAIEPDDQEEQRDESQESGSESGSGATSDGSDGSTGSDQPSNDSSGESDGSGEPSGGGATPPTDCRKDREDMTAMERWFTRSDTPDKPGGWEGCQTDEAETDESRTAIEIWLDRTGT